MDIECGLDGTPTWEKFSKIFLATSFYSATDPLVLKFDLIYLWCPIWYLKHFEYEFKTSFELESNSRIEDINESFRRLHFHLVLDTRNHFAKIKFHKFF